MLSCNAVLYTITCLVVTVCTGLAIPVLHKSDTGLGTTRNLERIFIGRCWEYQEVIRPDVFLDSKKDCDALWRNFTSAFSFKEPCNTTDHDYVPFAEAASHDISEDQSLFWENVYPFVNEFSSNGKRYTTIADTLFGFMVDQVEWCGQLEAPGINYDYCPTWDECESVNGQVTSHLYWLKVSEFFSTASSGQSTVLLNGSHHLPFDPRSTFATRELVNLTPENNVTNLHIMVLHDLGGAIIERCGQGSLLDLANQAGEQGLVVTCEDDPPSIRYFQCVDAPKAVECTNVTKMLPKRSRNSVRFL